MNLVRLLLLLLPLLLSHEGTGGLAKLGETANFLLGCTLLLFEFVENGLGVAVAAQSPDCYCLL